MAGTGIELRGVTKSFGAKKALDSVSLRFEPGLLHGIVGPNGAGKTTLLRLLTGLLKPSSGEIIYRNGSAESPLADIKDGLAYFPQEQSLYPDLSCAEHLEFFRDLYRLPRQTYETRSAQLLQMARLAPFKDRKAGQLSGGMYKKLGLICVLLHSPEILLLDEPTIGVDPVSRRELWEMLYSFGSTGMLIILSTSYMDEAERCARVHLFDGGKLAISGEPRALLAAAGAKNFEEIFLRAAGEGR